MIKTQLQIDLEQMVKDAFFGVVPGNCRNCGEDIRYHGDPPKQVANAVYNFLLKEGHIKEE